MQPNPASMQARTAAKPNRLSALFASLFAMLVPASQPSTDAVVGFESRRAMLAMAREEKADMNAVKEIGLGFILIGIALLIALTFWPAITSAVATAQADANTTGSTDTIIGLIPLVLAVALLIGAVVFLFRGFKQLSA